MAVSVSRLQVFMGAAVETFNKSDSQTTRRKNKTLSLVVISKNHTIDEFLANGDWMGREEGVRLLVNSEAR